MERNHNIKIIYENNIGKEIHFGFETQRLICIDDNIKIINDLFKKLNVNTF